MAARKWLRRFLACWARVLGWRFFDEVREIFFFAFRFLRFARNDREASLGMTGGAGQEGSGARGCGRGDGEGGARGQEGNRDKRDKGARGRGSGKGVAGEAAAAGQRRGRLITCGGLLIKIVSNRLTLFVSLREGLRRYAICVGLGRLGRPGGQSKAMKGVMR